MNRTAPLPFALVIIPMAACGVTEPAGEGLQSAATATEQHQSSLINGTYTQPGGLPVFVPPPACATVCTTASRCDTGCTDGTEKTCGAFGVCVSCAAACTSTAWCGQACLENGQLNDCRSARRTCVSCSESACRTTGCAGYCMNPPSPRCAYGLCTPTYSRCDAYGATIGDKDSDGLPDALEDALARRFFPSLRMSMSSQHQFYGLDQDTAGYDTLCRGNPNCKLPYVVRPVPQLYGARQGWCTQGQCVELSFVLPYNWDLGDVGGATSHRGDAEFVSILLAYRRADDEPNGLDWGSSVTWAQAKADALVWRQVGRFYAAHMCSPPRGVYPAEVDPDSSRFVFPSTSVSQAMSLSDSMPVYVAESKNGSYPSMGSCDEGGAYFDNCEGGVWLDRNVLLPKLVNAGEEVGGAIANPGYVCSGFQRTLANPMYPFAPSTTTLDIWGTAPFDTSTKLYHLLRRFELDWGYGKHSCAW